MKKRNRNLVIGTGIILGIVGIMTIFFLSNMNGIESNSLSHRIANIIAINIYGESPTNSQYESLHLIVRKFAHLTLYLALASVIYTVVYWIRRQIFFAMVIGWMIPTVIAGLDELNQRTVLQRTGTKLDILIDSYGALLAVTILGVLSYLIKYWHEHEG